MHGDLWQYFLANPGNPIVKLPHYFPIYERHLVRFRGMAVTVVEIGCAAGGSLQMWKHYFGESARVVGLDVDPRCRLVVNEPRVEIMIGDQADRDFLDAVLEHTGRPDIVIDDGSHRGHDINASFDALYPRMSERGVYIVEDLHTAYWPEYGPRAESFTERCKSMIDELHARHSRGSVTPTLFTETTESMHVYDSMVVFERGPRRVLPAMTPWGHDSQIGAELVAKL